MDVSAKSPSPAWAISLRPTAVAKLVFDFYRKPTSWLALALTLIVIIYGGGAAMFWFHSVYLGEGGPAISPWLHWLIDSTAGLLGLAPALFVLLPLATHFARVGMHTLRPLRFALFSGGLFALLTAPGPIVHNELVGRGTWLADQATRLWGDGRAVPPYTEFPIALSTGLQVLFGLPVYIGLMLVVYFCVRSLLLRTKVAQ